MTFVRVVATGEKLLCCWDDCGQWGHAEFFTESMGSGGLPVKDIYCSLRHREYALNATRLGNGILPTGSRETWRS